MTIEHSKKLTSALWLVVALMAQPARALHIDVKYSGAFDTDDPSGKAARVVANAAISTWEVLASPWEKVKDYRFAVTIGSSGLGSAFALTYNNMQTAAPYASTGTYLWTKASIDFGIDSWEEFYWDPTPADNSEFNMTQYGGLFGLATAGSGAVGKEDAYSVILHELGHALGFIGATDSDLSGAGDLMKWEAYKSFGDNLTKNPGSFTFDYLPALSGTQIPMGDDPYHIFGGPDPACSGPTPSQYCYDSMSAGISSNGRWSGPGLDQRRLISALDLNMIADAFHLVPEPDTLVLLGIALAGLGATHRRKPA